MSDPSDFFIAGGTLRAQAPSYVTRPADQELFKHTLAGEFCYVLTPRQMGKSSLIIRTIQRLAAAGCKVANLDLTGIGSGSAEQWYLGLLTNVSRELRLNVDVLNWWQERAALTIPQRFSEFLREIVLQEIASPIVIFIDEIDSTLNLDFRDDFFAAIRAIYNARAAESAYKRLTFALLGVATPTDLIHDRERTPFNIGRRIILREFSYDEAESLRTGLEACHPGQGDVILRRIFDWTNGYPYLTQKLCLAAAERPATDWNAAQVDELVEATFFSDAGRKDPNFKFVQQRIQESSIAERRQMLNIYGKVYGGKAIPDDTRSQSQNHLELYGLVRVDKGKLNVRNDTYRRIFDQQWIEANMPANRDLGLAIGASLVALLVIVAVWFFIRQTPSPSASLYAKQFNDNAFPTARIEALAGLFNLQDGLYDRDDEQGLSLFYTLNITDQLDLFSEANARARGREMVTMIRRISLTLDQQDVNGLAIMREMITALGVTGQSGADSLAEELINWKSGRELAEKGQYQNATTAYSDTILLNPNNLAARYDRASARIKWAKYGEALEDLNQIIIIAKTATPSPTAVPTAAVTSTAVPTVTGVLLASPIIGTPVPIIGTQSGILPSTTAGSSITATSVITSTLQPGTSTSRFISTEMIISAVADTIRGNEELLRYLRDPQNHTTANQDLRAMLKLFSPGAQQIFIDAPLPGTLIGSPMQLKGRTQRMPSGGQLSYQVRDSDGQVIGSNNLPVSADDNGGGSFDAPLTFTLPKNGGTVVAELFERASDGSFVATSSIDLFTQSQVQSITINSPQSGTEVSSPIKLTGQVARVPSQGFLSYIVTNSSQQQIGSGTFPVSGEQGRPAIFVGSVGFALPLAGDTIVITIYDEDPRNGTRVDLLVAQVSPPNTSITTTPTTMTPTNTPMPRSTLTPSVVIHVEPPMPPSPFENLEIEMINLLNAQRRANGCGLLQRSSSLTISARGHSEDMATHNFFDSKGSQGSDRISRARVAGYVGKPGTRVRENLASGDIRSFSAQFQVDTWMAAPLQRSQILDCTYNDVGVGFAHNDASEYLDYWTVAFGVGER